MVLFHKSTHIFQNDFATVSLAFFNRYPNPYSKNVLSTDTLAQHIDPQNGKLYKTRLIKKDGKLPRWIMPFLGKITTTYILEKSIVDPMKYTMETYMSNIDHLSIMRVEEYTTYKYDNINHNTIVSSEVKFSSTFREGIRNKVESWSRNKFDESVKKSREGMVFVMKNLQMKSQNMKEA
ncbi:hypothetical protein TBLA_0A09110 [Henningerozyma blattae CBS 6284]|uniref:PRELI/MSF1 domain-containing protein n=1 Tax=Henningerozyma blattae (strain ATCC 34711 / CBS 6284 / DSM 70876 / NBRC 10599 / NRRL Y-10934 / UCD 77-7) TaxID=1071380 RepID=I2GX47_HENB6|nr:hypothetical protein TBLA_0A09110 [Tetrapisispora blattae CBS 6284]CCH58699.1 hypothetical protein TBLA_0A09110 [Tetrapisispora blattae CBS 6284]